MRVITGFFPPTSGKVRVAGYDVVDSPLEANGELAIFRRIHPFIPI